MGGRRHVITFGGSHVKNGTLCGAVVECKTVMGRALVECNTVMCSEVVECNTVMGSAIVECNTVV